MWHGNTWDYPFKPIWSPSEPPKTLAVFDTMDRDLCWVSWCWAHVMYGCAVCLYSICSSRAVMLCCVFSLLFRRICLLICVFVGFFLFDWIWLFWCSFLLYEYYVVSCCILEGLCYDVFYVLLDYVCVLEGYVMLYFVFS